MNTKSPWLSKMIWMNALGGLFAAFALFFPSLGGVGTWISANASLIGIVWSVLNLGLRAITKDKIQLTD